MRYEGNLIITKENVGDFAALEHVSGYLRIWSDAQLPALTSVGGSLEISADAQLPALETVGGFDIAKGDLAASRFAAVAREALQPGALNMEEWHLCETCHCIAGWAEVIAKREGREYPGVGPAVIGAIELGVDAAKLFFKTNQSDRASVIAALEAARDAVPVVEAA